MHTLKNSIHLDDNLISIILLPKNKFRELLIFYENSTIGLPQQGQMFV